jgi:FlaA1/EpsC-like NDP-sugar epimerase
MSITHTTIANDRHRAEKTETSRMPLKAASLDVKSVGTLNPSSPNVSPGSLSRILSSLSARAVLYARSQLKSVYRNRYLFLLDQFTVAFAFLAACFLRFGQEGIWAMDNDQRLVLLQATGLFVLCSLLVFPLSGLYRRNWKYASISEMSHIVKTVLVLSLIFVGLMFFTTRMASLPRSVVMMEALILAPLLLATRVRSRLGEMAVLPQALSYLTSNRYLEAVPVMLVGIGSSTDLFLRALMKDNPSNYYPIGILDDSPDQQDVVLRNVPVIGKLSEFAPLVSRFSMMGKRPRHIIFTEAPNKFSEHDVQALMNEADLLGVGVSRISAATELRKASSQNRYELRSIELTDLLERPQAALDRAAIGRLVYGRSVLVTGAGGSIGSELVRQIASLMPAKLILAENCEYNLYAIDLELLESFPEVTRKPCICDVRDRNRVNAIFDEHQPEIVFHAAALKHVPMVELNPCEGVLTNAVGTMNVAEAALRVKAKAMVQISTDKAVNTSNAMGATKRVAELFCQALDIDGKGKPGATRFMTVRFGNVLGSSGSLIPLFKRQIAMGGPLTVTDPEMTRYFMTIREAVELTMQASAYGLEKKANEGEIFVLDMGKPIKIIDIAKRMIRLAGFEPERDIKITIVGRRPGEKLFEELFDVAEKRVDSPVPGVMGAVPSAIDLATIRKVLHSIERTAKSGDEAAMFGQIKTILPGYTREQRSKGDYHAHGADASSARKRVDLGLATEVAKTALAARESISGPVDQAPLNA